MTRGSSRRIEMRLCPSATKLALVQAHHHRWHRRDDGHQTNLRELPTPLASQWLPLNQRKLRLDRKVYGSSPPADSETEQVTGAVKVLECLECCSRKGSRDSAASRCYLDEVSTSLAVEEQILGTLVSTWEIGSVRSPLRCDYGDDYLGVGAQSLAWWLV